MADSNLTTADILALCREQDGGGGSAPAAPEPAAPAAEAPSAEAPAAPEPAAEAPATASSGPPPTFGDRPKSTADILAAARAETASAGAAPAASAPAPASPAKEAAPAKPQAAAPSGPTPSSTSDILAAARAQAAGGGGDSPKPAAPAGATPSSTSDILAAARAQAGGAPAAAKPAAKAAPAGDKPKADSSGRPSVQEMLKAVREEKSKSDDDGKPKLPQRPAPSKVRVDDKPKRRNFLVAMFATPFALAWTAFTAATAVAGLGLARFMLPNATVEPPSKFKVGIPGDYPLGTVSTKWKSQFAIWITHQVYNGQSQIYALSTVCTHLGCTPNWLEGEQKFKCPCHGSGFYGDGINFEGPAPRPLERYGIKVAADGQLEVDKGLKFQEEMQQWNDAASFVATSG